MFPALDLDAGAHLHQARLGHQVAVGVDAVVAAGAGDGYVLEPDEHQQVAGEQLEGARRQGQQAAFEAAARVGAVRRGHGALPPSAGGSWSSSGRLKRRSCWSSRAGSLISASLTCSSRRRRALVNSLVSIEATSLL